MFRGPPQAQRWAVDELAKLKTFYFPECAAAPSSPQCHWFGECNAICLEHETTLNCGATQKHDAAGEEDVVSPDGGQRSESGENIDTWEGALRLEWSEDDNLYDEDLPTEPLEAPDDGPDVFEGEALSFEQTVELPLRVLLLV